MKLIESAIVALIANLVIRAKVVQLFANRPLVTNSGGMTLDMGNGPIVVCEGKMSLADEKSLRVELRTLDSKAKLSRTNDIAKRVSQYAVAENAEQFAKMQSVATEKKESAKTEKKDKTVDPTPAQIATAKTEIVAVKTKPQIVIASR